MSTEHDIGHLPETKPLKAGTIWLALGVILVIFGIVFFVGFLPKLAREKTLAEAVANTNAAPSVTVVKPLSASDTNLLALPGNIEPLRQTGIYGRANGYVRRWTADLGSYVRVGQLLAELETPELNQQVQQAQANVQLAKVNLDRINSVTLPGAVAQQDRDTRQSAYDGALANLRQLQALSSYRYVTAPFSGIITARNIDIGSLVNAGAGAELFRLMEVDTMRIFIDVPQTFSSLIKTGQMADVAVQELPKDKFVGIIERTAGALDPASRTLSTVVYVPNTKRRLLAGMYAQVKLQLLRKDSPLVIQASTLIIRAQGPQVVVVDDSSRLHFRSIKLGRDLGSTVEVVDGLTGAEHLVNNPSDDLHEGQAVQVVQPKENQKITVK